MRYICEIDVAWDGENWQSEQYCGNDCGYYERKEESPYCSLFHKELKLDEEIYEIFGILRCKGCRDIFYPAPQEKVEA